MKRSFETALIILSIAFSSCGSGEGDTSNTDSTQVDTLMRESVEDSTMQVEVNLKKRQAMLGLCNTAAECNDVPCQEKIADLHSYNNETTFMRKVNAYHATHGISPVPPPLEVPVATIKSYLADCDKNRIMFDITKDNSTHQNIKIWVEPGYWPKPLETNSYSIALFKGILSLYPAIDTFKFYRGIAGMSNNLETMMIAGYAGGTGVYFGDLSDAYPSPPSTPSDSTKIKK